jgi:hypothetical protein
MFSSHFKLLVDSGGTSSRRNCAASLSALNFQQALTLNGSYVSVQVRSAASS